MHWDVSKPACCCHGCWTDIAALGTNTGICWIPRRRSADLDGLIGDWLHDTALPGFIPSSVTSHRVSDDTQGNPRYQSLVSIYNGETVPGLLRLQYLWGDETAPVIDQTAPFSIPGGGAVEVGILTRTPLLRLTMRPYLALNRLSTNLGEFELDAGPVSLEVSNKTTGNVVFADAIRWKPVESAP